MVREIWLKIVKIISSLRSRISELVCAAEPEKEVSIIKKESPKNLEEFIAIIQRTPKSVLSSKDRDRIAAVMSFEGKTVGDLMADKSRIVFVKSNEMLGPLVLDKLYKTGGTIFPVVDGREKVIGVLNTEALNALEDRKLERAEKYMNRVVSYLSEDWNLGEAVKEMKRMGAFYYLVRNQKGEIVGYLTMAMLLDYLSL